MESAGRATSLTLTVTVGISVVAAAVQSLKAQVLDGRVGAYVAMRTPPGKTTTMAIIPKYVMLAANLLEHLKLMIGSILDLM